MQGRYLISSGFFFVQMILMKYPPLRKAAAPVDLTPKYPKEDRTPNAADRSRANQFKITPEEFVRRDNIVRQQYLDCILQVGDVCEPVALASRELYGKCTIKKILRTYHDFTTASGIAWPEDDRPMIVEAEPEKKHDGTTLICCTPKYLQKWYGSYCT